jgi:hypothetical protein
VATPNSAAHTKKCSAIMPISFPEIVTAHAADPEESRADGDDVTKNWR